MTQRDRDRLVVLKKALKKLIKQSQAAKELGVSARQVKRLLRGLREKGDKAVIHGQRGRESKRKTPQAVRERIVRILSQEVYRGFGPTLASEYLAEKHDIRIGRETLRKMMLEAGLWRARSCRGELVQWDTSEHDWLEGRGEKLYLIHMIDDATSELTARFARHDSTEENMQLLWTYLEKHGRPVGFYTDKASMFVTTPKVARNAQQWPLDQREPLPPTQIGRALRELGIVWIPAHSPQAKGRVERSFATAPRPVGERTAGGGSLHAGGREPLFGAALPAVVESASGSAAGESGGCAPAAWAGTQSGRRTQPRRDAASGQRLHISAGRQKVPAGVRADAGRVAWRNGAHRAAAGRTLGCALPRALSERRGVRRGSEDKAAAGAAKGGSCTPALGPERNLARSDEELSRQAWRASMEGGGDQSHANHRPPRVIRQKANKDRRAKPARRSLALNCPRPPLGGSTKECAETKTPPKRFASEGSCRFFGASPVASALGIRSGATPRGRPQPTMPSPVEPSKGDISTWQTRGHFYLALTPPPI
jgi:transposase